MYSNESSGTEPSGKGSKHSKDRKKHKSKADFKSDRGAHYSASRQKPPQDSDTEDEYYYNKSDKRKPHFKSKSESNHRRSSKRKDSSELSDSEQAQIKSKIDKKSDFSQKDKRRTSPSPKRSQSNHEQNLRNYTKSKWSDLSDSARTPSPKRKNRQESNKHNVSDSGLNYKHYERVENKSSRNKRPVSSDSSRSPSPKRSKRKDEDENVLSHSSFKKLTREFNDRESNESKDKHKKKKNMKNEEQEEESRSDKSKNRTSSPKSKDKAKADGERDDSYSGRYKGSKDKMGKKLRDDHNRAKGVGERDDLYSGSKDKVGRKLKDDHNKAKGGGERDDLYSGSKDKVGRKLKDDYNKAKGDGEKDDLYSGSKDKNKAKGDGERDDLYSGSKDKNKAKGDGERDDLYSGSKDKVGKKLKDDHNKAKGDGERDDLYSGSKDKVGKTLRDDHNKAKGDGESDDLYSGSKDKVGKKLRDDHNKVFSRKKQKSIERDHHNTDDEEQMTVRSGSDTRERSHSPRDRSRNGRDRYDDGGYSQKPIKFENYWSGGMNIRKNSDNYWNKYPVHEGGNLQSSDKHEVGPRYYGVSSKKRQQKSKDKKSESEKQNVEENEKSQTTPVEKPNPVKKSVDLLTSKTGGAYIPPARLRMMQESITDKSSAAYQRLAWEALKKSIQGLVNKINISNIVPIVKELQRENIVRGRGLLCRAIIQAQATSPTFTHVYAALVAAINTKFPNIGELLLKRLVVQFRRGFKRNDKTICITAATFIAHLVNHQVAHEILALEILTLLVESPTNDSVEVAIAFLKECGMKLSEVSKKGIVAIFDMLRNILHEGNLEKRVQYMIEVMFQIRKDEFKAHPSIVEGLNLVFEEDQFMHLITLEEEIDTQDILNVFKFDPDYEANEAKYKTLVVQDSDEEESGESGDSDDEDDSDEESEDEETGEKKSVIIDRTETNLVALRRTIYLTIQSSLDFEECAHKLLRMQIKPGQEIEMCHMFLDCCAEQRTYEKFYGLLAQRFCQINRTYIAPFEETFRDSYATIHRIETDKLRNIAKLFAHLLFTDAISWEVLSTIRLNEDDTTSSSRIFIKILFLELSEYMGLAKLNQRVKDPSLQTALEGLFPRDNPKNTRFAINFFTSIGLGGLTDELREHLKTQPKPSIAVPQLVEALSSSSDSSSSSESSSDSSSDSSSSDSSSESEESTPERKPKKRNKTKRLKETKALSKKSAKTKKAPTNKKKKPNR